MSGESPKIPAAEPPILNIIGDKVALGPQRRDLMTTYQRWVNDFEVTRTLGIGVRPITFESEEKWYNGMVTSEREVGFLVYERATLRPIGGTGLHQIDYFHRTASFGIMIGEKDCWNKGYGTEIARLMLDYGFNVLGLHNIMLTAFSHNERGLRAYRRAGYREIGRRREAYRLGRQAFDVVYMECLETEFTGSTLTRGSSNAPAD
jgi:RimJ/RimL family protein N-acetyltransferase